MKPFDPRLLKYAKEARTYIALLVVLGFLATAFIAAQTFLIAASAAPVFYGEKTLNDVLPLIGGLGAVILLRAGLSYTQAAFGHRSAVKIIARMRASVLDHAGALGNRWLSQGNTSRVVTLATRGLDSLEAYFVSFLPQLFLCATATPALIIVILYLDWVSAIAIVLCIPLIPIFMVLIGKMTASYSSQRLKSMEQLGTQMLDLLSGLATLKAVGREQAPKARVRLLGDRFAKKTMQTLYVAFLSGAALEFLATLSTAIVAVEVGFRMVAGNLMLFEGLVIITLTPEVFKPLREVGTQFHASADGVAAAEEAFEILETELPLDSAPGSELVGGAAHAVGVFASSPSSPSSSGGSNPDEPSSSSGQIPDLDHAVIAFDAVSVNAPGRATVAPSNLSGTIPPGKVTVLEGKSGSGKSTAVQVLLGTILPDAGTIRIGDRELRDCSRELWWDNVTWVPQRPAIVPGTILNNVLSHSASEPEPADRLSTQVRADSAAPPTLPPEVLRAAQTTGFLSVVESLPAGWNTRIGQGGVGLSVGQRQRLGLTRALLSPKKLVILDEPSAHLDAMSEEHVANAVRELKANGHTVLV
ncbi:MAG: thiol reductant ABC exporter subunit CydD, partial [Arcanobacterium sp.]|nr:thiol reductant ABC exporter subunit CydD [Arcanobacterium sp.]